MTLPNFLLIGAMKAGTTSLSRYLGAHPDVFMSDPKELNFFRDDENRARGVDWYQEQFRDAGSAVAVGEASVSYTTYPSYRGVPSRIVGVLPEVRLIYLIRDPIERMRSQYLHYLYWQPTFDIPHRETRGIREALLSDRGYRYLDHSRYAFQIEQYLDRVPREAMLLLTSEDLGDRREEVLRRVFGFLGVDDSFVPPNIDREYLRTSERRPPRGWVLALRRNHAYRRIASRAHPAIGRRAPRLLRAGAHRVMTEGVDPGRAVISAALRRELEDLLRDDVSRLAGYMPPGFDGWGMLGDRSNGAN